MHGVASKTKSLKLQNCILVKAKAKAKLRFTLNGMVGMEYNINSIDYKRPKSVQYI